jgi:hypothetical protein
MKALVILLTTIVTFNVQAQSAELDSGLECTMSYSASGPISMGWAVYTKSSWLAAGKSMQGDAVIFDGNGEYTASSAAHYVEAQEVVKQGYPMWEVSILNGEKSLISSFIFDKTSGMKVSIPVRAFAHDSEDPEEFDTLEVSCHFIYFVG